MERRQVFRIIASGAASATLAAGQHQRHASFSAAGYQPRFFSPSDYEVIDRLADIIIPSDAQSPGAHAAGVAFYIDTMLHYAEPALQQRWRGGLSAVKDLARAKFGKDFLSCSRDEQEQIVGGIAAAEMSPASEAEKFFVALKRMTIDGYHLSDVGMRQYLGYQGNTAISEFPGCRHERHKS